MGWRLVRQAVAAWGPGLQAGQPPVLPVLLFVYFTTVLLTMSVVMPPWQNPDEPLHMARAVQVAHGGLVGFRAWGTSGGLSDPAIYESYMKVRHAAMHPRERLSAADLAAAGTVMFSKTLIYVSFPNTVQYPPFFYVPDAVAYWVGRLAHLSVVQTLRLARMANGLAFAAAATAAICLARRARPLLAALLTLPASLALGCSASQDALLLGASALAVALVDRSVAGGHGATRFEVACVAVLLTLVAMARPPYLGFIVLIPLLHPRAGRAGALLVGVAAAAVLAWCGFVALHASVRLGQSDPVAQLNFISGHIGLLPAILGATTRAYLADYWWQMIGVIGWTDTVLPSAYLWTASAVLLLATAASAAGPSRRPAWAAFAALFAIVAIFLLQYLAWTWPEQLVITGVLGRYFTPVAMVCALALPAWAKTVRLRRAAFVAITVLAAVAPAVMLYAILWRYFLA